GGSIRSSAHARGRGEGRDEDSVAQGGRARRHCLLGRRCARDDRSRVPFHRAGQRHRPDLGRGAAHGAGHQGDRGADMTRMTRMIVLAVLSLVVVTSSGYAADIDRTAVDLTAPPDIKWVRNAAGTNESAVLFGDPSKPGPYV